MNVAAKQRYGESLETLVKRLDADYQERRAPDLWLAIFRYDDWPRLRDHIADTENELKRERHEVAIASRVIARHSQAISRLEEKRAQLQDDLAAVEKEREAFKDSLRFAVGAHADDCAACSQILAILQAPPRAAMDVPTVPHARKSR
jgi:chromosome segregation ATPase